MKKLYPYIALSVIALCSFIPPIDFRVMAPLGDKWFMLILSSIFLGVNILFLRVNLFIKLASLFVLINCFFSSVPYISFNAYISSVFCFYFYILCSKIKDWEPVFKALKIILLMNLLLMAMQFIGKDSLLNFGLKEITCYGIIGQHMQMGSFSVVLAMALLPLGIIYIIFPFLVSVFCISIWTAFAAGIGLCVYSLHSSRRIALVILLTVVLLFTFYSHKYGKFIANMDGKTGRVTVWRNTVRLSNTHPWIGHGIGTYKAIFPALSGMLTTPWKTAHNFWLQLLFEIGYPGTLAVLAGMVLLFIRLYRAGEIHCLTGLTMLNVDWLAHFPDRMLQAVLIIILFLAFCKKKLNLAR